MSQNNTQEEGAKSTIVKPIALPLKSHFMRTVSAQPTVGENTSQSGESKEVKLNTNAPAFVPKEKRPDSTTATSTTKPEVKETPVITPTPQQTAQPVYGGQAYPSMPMSGYQAQKPYSQSSYIPYTYLNTTPMGYPAYPSPNTRAPQQFFPNQMGMAPNMPYQPQYQVPYGQKMPMPTYGMTAPLNPTASSFTPLSTATPTPTSTTTQPSTSLSDKKFNFSKDSKSFIPKSLRGKENIESAEKEPERKTSITQEAPKETQTEVTPVENKEDVKQPEVKPEISTPKSSVETKVQTPINEEIKLEPEEKKEEKPVQINIEAKTPVIYEQPIATETKTEEPKKVEKKSKLSDLLDKPSTGPKVTAATANKKVVVATPTVVASKPKVNDLQKSLEEKRKQLLNQQKQQAAKPSTPTPSQPKKCKINNFKIFLDVESTPLKEEKEEPTVVQPKIEEKEETPIPSDEEDEEQQPPRVPVRHYFLQDEKQSENVKNHVYSIEYLKSFQNWKICQEQNLLSDMLKQHLEKMKIWEDERPKGYKQDKRKQRDGGSDGRYQFSRGNTQSSAQIEDKSSFTRSAIKLEPQTTSTESADAILKKWGRKDMSEAEKMAADFKAQFEEKRKEDPVRNELTELLNILTVDNYDDVKSKIFEIIKSDVENQKKFLETLFKKAVSEKSFVSLYAKICKDLDREVPQKNEKDPRTSQMRTYLVDKCREIFKTDNSKVDQYIKVTDPEEREAKLKKFLLGNVNFIGELINAKLLSKKIVFQCINNLLVRIEKADDQSGLIKQINIEAIVILIDKFGTLINKYDAKMKPEELNEFNQKINDYLNKLDSIQDADKNLPGHIRYKIINLIEKRNRGWEESKVDKQSTAKGIKEVREEHETEQRTGTRAAKLDQEIVNSKIREDLYSWKDHLNNGYPAEEYHWEVTDALYRKHKNTVADFLTAFGENCIDFVGKHDDISTAYSYIREILNYYSQKLDKKDKFEILEVTLFFLQNLNDFSLDNNLLVSVWAGVLYLLEFYKIFTFTDLDKLKDVNDDQLKAIFEVVNDALKYYEDDARQEKLKELNSVTLIKANKSLFQSIVEN
jgi:hypothetical protein